MTGPLFQLGISSFASSGSLLVSLDSMSTINWAIASSANCHRVAMLTMSCNLGLHSCRIRFCKFGSLIPRISSSSSQFSAVIFMIMASCAFVIFLSHHVRKGSPFSCLHAVNAWRRQIMGLSL